MRQIALCCALAGACLGPPDDLDEVSDTEQESSGWDGGRDAPGEVIHVEGDGPGPCQGCPWGQGAGHANGGRGGDGGAAGGGSGDDRSQPAKKDCTAIVDIGQCKDCCDYNADRHDAWACNRMPKRTKEQKRARARCFEELEQERSRCYKDDCGRLIIYETSVGP